MRKPRSGLVAAVALIAALGMGSAVLGTPANLPFFESFETYGSGALATDPATAWSLGEPTGSATVATTNKIVGDWGCTASLADLTLAIDAGEDATNVWTQIYTKPTLYDMAGGDPVLDAGTVASFFVTTTGKVRANDGASYTEIGSVTTGGALAFSVHTDFVNDKWDLFVSSDGIVGTVMERLNTSPLNLNPNAAAKTRLAEFTVEGIAVLDAVALAKDVNSVPDLHTLNASNVIVVAKNLTGLYDEDISLQAHAYSIEADTALGGALGDDIARNLVDGDEVRLRTAAATPVFVRDVADASGTGWNVTGAGGLDPDAAYVKPGTAVWVKMLSSGPFVLFSDYKEPSSFTTTVYGTDAGGGGVNSLAWDKPSESMAANVNSFGFTGVAAIGDWLYLRQGGGTLLVWNGSQWRDGKNAATQTLSVGEPFWYIRRKSGPNGTWNLPSVQ